MSNDFIVSDLSFNLDMIKSPNYHFKRAHHRAIKNWLNNYQSQPGASNFDEAKGYLEACNHFFELQEWEKAYRILSTKFNIRNDRETSDKELGKQLGNWGYYQKQIELYTKLYGKLYSKEDADILSICGSANRLLGTYEEAQIHLKDSLNIYKQTGEQEKCAELWFELGLLYADQGKDIQAFLCHKKALNIYKIKGNYKGIVAALNNIARIATNRNKYRQAKMFHRRIKAIYDTYLPNEKNQEGYAWLLYNIGRSWADESNNTEAEIYTKKSLEIFEKLDLKTGISYSYYSLGILMLNFGDTNSAHNYCQKALELFKELNHLGGMALTYHILGRVAFRLPNLKLAKKYYQEVIKITSNSTGSLMRIANALGGFARLSVLQNQPYRAALLFGAADRLREVEQRPLPTADLPEYDDSVSLACTQIGKTMFTAAWESGKKLSVDEAVAIAMSNT